MPESQQAELSQNAVADEVAAQLPRDEVMSIPTTGKRGRRRTRPAREKSTRRAETGRKNPKARSKSKQGDEKQQVVFAFRLSEAERSRIHEAAGAGQATRFVRGAALAVATGDRKALEGLMAQAKKAHPGK